MAGVSLYISGLGAAVPDGRIGNDFLEKAGITPPAGAPASRATAVALSYLQQTSNVDPAEAVAHLSEAPTALGMSAGARALEQAGIAITDIGLMIGECITPLETTPSEVQRVGGGLGYKGPAYDVISVTATWPRYVTLLQGFQDSRVPQHTLLVSTHTTTARISYSKGRVEGALFGDGAGAMLLSRVAPAAGAVWKVSGATWLSDSTRDSLVELPLYGTLSVSQCRPDLIRSQLDQLAQTIEPLVAGGAGYDTVVYNLPWSLTDESVLAHRLLAGKRLVSSVAENGYQFGASDIVSLIECGPTGASMIPRGQRVLLLSADGGIHCGAVLLERC